MSGTTPMTRCSAVAPRPDHPESVTGAASRGARRQPGTSYRQPSHAGQPGVISIRHWTGIDADPTVMRRKVGDLFEL